MRRSTARAARLALVLAFVSAPAAAAPIPLSELPAKPARYAQALGPVPAKITSGQHRLTISASPQTCLLPDPPKYWIDGDAVLTERWMDMVTDAAGAFGLERLVERAGGAELERIAVEMRDAAIVPTARSRIPLRAVAELPGVTVYAYRWASKIFLIARSRDDATARSDGGGGFTAGPECGTILVVLRVRDGASEVAQISGRAPATGKPFLVSASVSQTGRDPEPLLAVTARMLDR